ncbi:MAG: hypothetical protein JW983_02215 [Elusimicrobia bacterium]|nr:hypothetical protein [Elusimicrobiota bacterium]
MKKAKVISVIDGNTFRINPMWNFAGNTDNKIRILGLDYLEPNERSDIEIKRKLEQLILGKQVEYIPIRLSFDRLLANVYINDIDITTLL